jgi:hypothetical protein
MVHVEWVAVLRSRGIGVPLTFVMKVVNAKSKLGVDKNPRRIELQPNSYIRRRKDDTSGKTRRF